MEKGKLNVVLRTFFVAEHTLVTLSLRLLNVAVVSHQSIEWPLEFIPRRPLRKVSLLQFTRAATTHLCIGYACCSFLVKKKVRWLSFFPEPWHFFLFKMRRVITRGFMRCCKFFGHPNAHVIFDHPRTKVSFLAKEKIMCLTFFSDPGDLFL